MSGSHVPFTCLLLVPPLLNSGRDSLRGEKLLFLSPPSPAFFFSLPLLCYRVKREAWPILSRESSVFNCNVVLANLAEMDRVKF